MMISSYTVIPSINSKQKLKQHVHDQFEVKLRRAKADAGSEKEMQLSGNISWSSHHVNTTAGGAKLKPQASRWNDNKHKARFHVELNDGQKASKVTINTQDKTIRQAIKLFVASTVFSRLPADGNGMFHLPNPMQAVQGIRIHDVTAVVEKKGRLWVLKNPEHKKTSEKESGSITIKLMKQRVIYVVRRVHQSYSIQFGDINENLSISIVQK